MLCCQLRTELLLAVLPLLCVGTSAAAYDLVPPGSRGAAMAGALGAASCDGHAAWYNPALLPLGEHFRFSVGYSLASPSFDASVVNYGSLGHIPSMQARDDNGALSASKTKLLIDRIFAKEAQPEPLNGVMTELFLPFQRMLPRFPLRTGMAASIFVPCAGRCVVRVHSHTPDQPFYPLYGSRNQRLHILVGLGAELIHDLWSIGASASILADIRGTVGSITPISRFDPANPSQNLPEPSKSTFSQDLETTATPLFGTLLTPLKQLKIGLYYRFAENLSLDFAVDAGVSVDIGFPFESYMPYFLDSNFFFVPAVAGLAVAFTPTESLLLTAQADWTFWSGLADTVNITKFDVEPSVVNDEGGLQPLKQYGDFRVRSLPYPTIAARDTLSPKVGVEYALKGSTRFRCGWAYVPSALEPNQNWLNMLLDNTRHDITGGVGFSFYDALGYIEMPLLLDVNVGISVLEPRNNLIGLKDDAAGYHARGVVRTGGYLLSFGLEMTLQL